MAAQRQPIVPIDAPLQSWLATTSSANTRAVYTRDLQVFIAWTTQAGIAPLAATPVHIEAFRIHCEASGVSTATVHRRLSALSSFFRHAAAGQANPVDGTSRPAMASSPAAALAPVEAAGVWAAAIRLGPKTAALVGLVLLDGLKTNELLPIDVEHVRFTRAATLVAVPRRDGPPVALAVDRRTGAALRGHVAARRDGPLFLGDSPTRRPARLTRFGVDYLVKRTGVAAGLAAPLTVNTLRRNGPTER